MFGLSDDITDQLRQVLQRHPIIDEALIFGSRAKGCHTEGSDIDIAVKAHGITYRELLDISIQLEDLGFLYQIDVVDYYKNAGTPLSAHIDRVGKTFYRRGK